VRVEDGAEPLGIDDRDGVGINDHARVSLAGRTGHPFLPGAPTTLPVFSAIAPLLIGCAPPGRAHGQTGSPMIQIILVATDLKVVDLLLI
jgi:hypothetical protein